MRSVLELLAVILSLCLRLSKVIMLNVHCSLKDNLYNQILVSCLHLSRLPLPKYTTDVFL